MSRDDNLFFDLSESAERRPDKAAIVTVTGGATDHGGACAEVSYRELISQIERCSAALAAHGITRGMRVLFLVLPGADFVVIVHALIRLGAIPVFVDPGHPLERLLALIKEADPQALIAIPLAFMLKAARPDVFPNVIVSISVGAEAPGAIHYADLQGGDYPACAPAALAPDDTMMIAFTSGSTGVPKGVEFTTRMLRSVVAQQRAERYGFREDDVDLAVFPIMLIALPTIGMTLVLPHLDTSAPGKIDPAGLVALIVNRGCTSCIGSTPVFWAKLADYCEEQNIVLPSLRRVLLSGAPAPATLLRRLRECLPNAICHTPIGSTECGSVASIDSTEILAETAALSDRGAGICVGRPFSDHPVRVIALTPESIATWDAARPLPAGEVGEIVVQGPGVSPRYYMRTDATRLARIQDGSAVWHRTGDVGYFDEHGRLWFCGRASQVIEHDGKRYYPVMIEGVFNADASVFRSGLVRVPARGLALCVELRPGVPTAERAAKLTAIETRAREMQLPLAAVLLNEQGFPVDARHNAKIDYPALTAWASAQLEPSSQTTGTHAAL